MASEAFHYKLHLFEMGLGLPAICDDPLVMHLTTPGTHSGNSNGKFAARAVREAKKRGVPSKTRESLASRSAVCKTERMMQQMLDVTD